MCCSLSKHFQFPEPHNVNHEKKTHFAAHKNERKVIPSKTKKKR